MMRTLHALLIPALFMPLLPVHAQEKKDTEPAAYKVEFAIRDNADSAKTARRYTLRMDGDRRYAFKVGSRVPVAVRSSQPGAGDSGAGPAVNTQYTYLDVGVNIESMIIETNHRYTLRGSLDISTIVQHDAAHGANPPSPTVAQTRMDIGTGIELGQPTVIATIDDPVTARQFQVEATVTRVN